MSHGITTWISPEPTPSVTRTELPGPFSRKEMRLAAPANPSGPLEIYRTVSFQKKKLCACGGPGNHPEADRRQETFEKYAWAGGWAGVDPGAEQ